MGAISLASKLGENLIINPNFEKTERATSILGMSSDTYTADRYQLQLISASGHTVGYQDLSSHLDGTPLTPTGFSNTHARYRNEVAVGSLGTSDLCYLYQKVEGYNARKVYKKNSFFKKWAYTTKAGIYTIVVKDGGNSRYYLHEVNLPAGIWTEIKVPVKKIDTALGIWDSESGLGLRIGICLYAGTNFHSSSLDSWQAGNVFASSNQVNFSDAVDNRFYTTEWQYHEGIDEIPFHFLARDIGAEEELCQRYFEKSYNTGVAPGSVSFAGNEMSVANSLGNVKMTFTFKVDKRVTPSTSVYSPNTGNSGFFFESIGTDRAATIVSNGEKSFAAESSAFNTTTRALAQWTADSEL